MRRLVVRCVLAAALVGAIVVLGLAALPPSTLAYLAGLWINRPPDATPDPPVIMVPAGAVPDGPIGLREWVRPVGGDLRPVASGFLLQLPDGTVIGVTTAHSIAEYLSGGGKLAEVAFEAPGRTSDLAIATAFYADPGKPRTGGDLTGDYVLLDLETPAPDGFALLPDTRGQPQPGERVLLASGLGDGLGGRRLIGGTVQSVDAQGVWVLMDDMEAPDGMSGSPILSAYTGRVVGMTIARLSRGSRFLIGVTPIRAIMAAVDRPHSAPLTGLTRPR